MSAKRDGGAAFPLYSAGQPGMSLRDYFAAAALSAPWGEAVTPEVHPNGVVTAEDVAALAANCYALADALLAERQKETA